ncbi:MAG: PQQ-binding-like beta-propeller repeat protein [Pseudomonadota bacterium]
MGNSQDARFSARTGARLLPLSLGLAATLLLSACQEREVIIPGVREPVDAALTGGDAATDAAQEVTDAARAISLPAQVANTSAPQGIGTQSFRTDHASLGATLAPIWSVNIGQGDSRKHRINADPVVADGRIFTLDSLTTVSAVSTGGQLLWQADVRPDEANDDDGTGGGLAVDDGRLFVTTGFGALTALDVETGRELWTQDLNATASGRPTVFGDLVYLVAGDNTGWAIQKDTGRIAWTVTASESVTNVLGAPAPVVVDGLTVFSFGSGEMQAVFRQGGLRRWDSSVSGRRTGRALASFDDVTGRPVVAGSTIFAGNQAGRTVAIDAVNGRRIWTATEGALGTVLPVAGSVFQVSDRNELLRLDATDGTRIWGSRLPNFVKDKPRRVSEIFTHHGPVLAGGRLIVASSDGLIRSYDPASGALVGATEIDAGATTAPVVAGRTLYVVDRKGNLVAYR